MTQLLERKQKLEACSKSFLIQTVDKRSQKISHKICSSQSTDAIHPLEIDRYASNTANNRHYNQNATPKCVTNKFTRMIHLLKCEKSLETIPAKHTNKQIHAKGVNGLNKYHVDIALYTNAYQSSNSIF